MADMGMSHDMSGMGHDMSAMSPPSDQATSPAGSTDPHAAHSMAAMNDGMQTHPGSEEGNPLVDMQTMMPTSRLNDPGIGLRDNGRTVLSYADLKSAFEDPDGRDPGPGAAHPRSPPCPRYRAPGVACPQSPPSAP